MIRMRDDIPEDDMQPWRRFVLTAPPPGGDVAESSAAAARPPRGQYDFVDIVEAGQGLICSPGHDARTIARAADRAEDIGYVRDLQAFEHRMMTSIKEVNLRVSYQAQSQRTAYETELHEERQAYHKFLRLEQALLVRLETLKTHMSRMEWQRQSAEDLAVRQMMRIHVLEARSQINTGTPKKKLTDKYCPKGEIKKLKIELWNLKVRGNDVAAYTQRFQELALMCTKFLADETEKVDKYISGLPDNIHGNVMSARPKTLNDAIEMANDLMDQKLRTYAERQIDNKRKADDSSRNNQQQQPHKKQNVARAYTAGPGEKKLEIYPCAPSATTTTLGNVHPSVETARGACYECGNTGHIKKNCPKLKNRRNNNGNGTAQGRAYALGGRDASPDSNVIIAQEYLSKGCDVFLAHITTKEAKDKSKGKRLEDVPIVRDFPEVFPEDLPGIPPAQQVEFQIDLVPGAAPVARVPYRLAPSKIKELAEQLQELSDKGFYKA
ncbi:putative reverse transcriptase domain-containing protein [Tanacetum coccineum]